MSGNTEILSFDTKKFRIRIHKSTIHALGNPKYIDLLVNPEKRLVAVRAHDGTASRHDAHRVKQHLMESDNSYDIQSAVHFEAVSDNRRLGGESVIPNDGYLGFIRKDGSVFVGYGDPYRTVRRL